MVMQKIKAAVGQLIARAPVVRGRGEEATKQALVLPMLDALGYDIWNPDEVCPEFEADFATKKLGQKEKVDIAISLGGVPRIYIEVKAVDVQLDGHEGQLARYFNATPTVSLAILTNGMEYRFYTDTGDPNVMDSAPFHVAKLDAVDQGLDILARFHRGVFSPEAIRDFATELNFTAKMVVFLRGELDLRDREPSERLVRWILKQEAMYPGSVTQNVVERFAPIVKNALQIVLRDIVRRSVAALDKEVSSPAAPAPQAPEVGEQPPAATPSTAPTPASAEPAAEDTDKAKIVTTERELECFRIVKALFETSLFANGTIWDAAARKDVPIDLTYKDTTGYFVIFFNKPSSWALRISIESKKPWIAFNVDPVEGAQLIPGGYQRLEPYPYAEFRVGVTGPQDLNSLNRLVFAAFKRTVEERQALRQAPTPSP